MMRWTGKKEAKRPKMPKAAVLLNQTQEFESVTADVAAEIDLESILEEEGQPAGYVYLSPFMSRAAYDWTADVSVYVDPEKRGGVLQQQIQ